MTFFLGKIKYVKGDCSNPQAADNRSIVLFNGTNGEFEYAPGVPNAYDKVYKSYLKAKEGYRSWWRSQTGFALGKYKTQSISSTTEIIYTLVSIDGEFDFKALRTALADVANYCFKDGRNVHINKTDNWSEVEKIIEETFLKRGVNVYIYEG